MQDVLFKPGADSLHGTSNNAGRHLYRSPLCLLGKKEDSPIPLPAPDGMAGALLPPDLGQALCYNPNGFCNYTCEGQALRQSVCVCESTERKGISVHLCLSPRVCRMMKFADSAQ